MQSQNRRRKTSMGSLEQTNAKDQVKRIAIGADHGAFDAKQALKRYLETLGYKVIDVGTNDHTTKVDYPDFALAVAKKVVSGDCERGIMLDAAGIGSAMACNKVKGIRAALCWNPETIVNSRAHNNANVLTMGTLQHAVSDICSMSKLWLETRFEGGRHWPRINKMMSIERM
ncbi:MAG: RpiB/LacA/LacB family sugar-phosphate isomerase [Bacteroidales bacterium]|nr:RpiB/LacA/LacB family sugar-phosphate isomerase [Bacteroidales bacterium]